MADDLTGALDAAVQFAEAGWSARLLRSRSAGPEPGDAGPTLLAVSTDVRAAPDDVAADRTARAVRSLLARGCDRLYVKIDSTMRGSVAAQLRGALGAWSRAHPGAVLVLCPALPEQSRTVVDGVVLSRGIPVARTSAGADPVTPVADSRLHRLVPGAAAVTLRGLASTAPQRDSAMRMTFIDASTDADLDSVAEALDELGARAVAAGSAGLAAALARRWSIADTPRPSPSRLPPTQRILVAVSSLHPVTATSLVRLRGTLTSSDPAHPAVDVMTSPPHSGCSSRDVAADFGRRVAEQLRRQTYSALVLVGGDGAAAVLDHIGATAVTVHAAVVPGTPTGTIRGGTADGLAVVTKSGGFGDADTLVEIVRMLRSSAPRRDTR